MLVDPRVAIEAVRLCQQAGEDPFRSRWRDYVEQATASLAAKDAEKK